MLFRVWLTISLVSVLSPGLARATTADWDLTYTATPNADLSSMSVRLCWSGNPPKRIAALLEVPLGHVTTRLPRSRWAITTSSAGRNGCANYQVALDQIGRRMASGILTRGERWLLRPAYMPGDMKATLKFELPPGIQVVTPWPAAGDGFRLNKSAFTMTSRIAFGRFRTQQTSLSGTRLTLSIMDAPYKATATGIRTWITTAIRAAAQLWSRFPTDRVTVLVIPGRVGSSKVDHGMAHRGGGGHIVMYLGPSATDESLPGEWVAIHELLHLGMPWIAEHWMSEGFVTYYEEILRGRAGVLTEEQMWWELMDGFQRAKSDGSGRTLADESRDMHKTRAYKRVYWGGAASALLTDIRIRDQAGSQRSLDDAIRTLRPMCRSPEDWSAAGICKRLDTWAGSPMFTQTAAYVLKQTAFPDMNALLAPLGVGWRNGKVVLDDKAPKAALRRAIYTGRHHR